MKNFYKKTDELRLNILESIFLAKSGHPGGCLSCIDLIYYIFKNFLNYKKNFTEKKIGIILFYQKVIVPQHFMR